MFVIPTNLVGRTVGLLSIVYADSGMAGSSLVPRLSSPTINREPGYEARLDPARGGSLGS